MPSIARCKIFVCKYSRFWRKKTVKTSLDSFPRKAIATKVISTFLSLILTFNSLEFNCKNCIQIKGFAIGTICVPSYPNIFMGPFQRKYVSPFLQGHSLIYLRFTDNIFFIWTGSKEQLIWNLDKLNTNQGLIKFEHKN